jgi:hypothetical protein
MITRFGVLLVCLAVFGVHASDGEPNSCKRIRLIQHPDCKSLNVMVKILYHNTTEPSLQDISCCDVKLQIPSNEATFQDVLDELVKIYPGDSFKILVWGREYSEPKLLDTPLASVLQLHGKTPDCIHVIRCKNSIHMVMEKYN